MPTYTNTTRFALRKPAINQKVNDFTAIIDALADDTDAKLTGYSSGVAAAMGAATTAGRLYFQTDTGLLFFNTGAAWQLVSTANPNGQASGGAQAASLGNGPTVLGASGYNFGATFANHLTFSTSTGYFTVPIAGVYQASGTANLAMNNSAQTSQAGWGLCILHNGSTVPYSVFGAIPLPTQPTYTGLSLSNLVSCAAGDTLGLQASGAAMSNTIPFATYVLNVCRVG